MHADGADIMGEHITHRVLPYFSDKGCFSAQRGNAHRGIGRRAARNNRGRTHRAIKPLGLGLVDQPHRALGEMVGDQKIIFRMGQHINNCVADA